jgi:ergothioneine biosynthesis protein EgtB
MASRTLSPATDKLDTHFVQTRSHSCALAAPLSDADATVQSMPDASPAKWHLAHTTWFFETFVLRDYVPGYAVFDPAWHFLFNSYYDSEGDRHARARRGMLTRPTLDALYAYRAHVDAAVLAALPKLPDVARDLVELGCHHEAQHQELLLTDILHLFAQNPLAPALRSAPLSCIPSEPTSACWTVHDAGLIDIGHAGPGFAFDCESPRHKSYVGPHALSSRLVTNAEWQAFIMDGGYRRPDLWLSDGWSWVQAEAVGAPLYWRGSDRFGLEGLRPIEPNEPVAHISYFEAEAFARWSGGRLPTEFEWEVAAGDPGMDDMFGAVWQWTASAFLPYPGFRVADGAVGEYNGKFMSGQMVLRGSSHATPPGTSRVTTRNFFPPTARWQFSGLRLAKDI